MPNGGVPIHMALTPRAGDVVIYCQAGEMRIIAKDAWDREKARASPLCVLTPAEAGALAWQLRYWLGDENLRAGYNMSRDVDAEYDF